MMTIKQFKEILSKAKGLSEKTITMNMKVKPIIPLWTLVKPYHL